MEHYRVLRCACALNQSKIHNKNNSDIFKLCVGYRLTSGAADNLANEGQMGNNGFESHVQNPTASHWKYLAGFWDGALKTGNSTGGCGAWIGGSNILKADVDKTRVMAGKFG